MGRVCPFIPRNWSGWVECVEGLLGPSPAAGLALAFLATVVSLALVWRFRKRRRKRGPILIVRPSREGEWADALSRVPSGSGGPSTPPSAEVARREPPTEWIEAGPIRFGIPSDATLQLLPGRLEVEPETGAARELRFVRLPGHPPEFTFGRKEGPAFRHIQLCSPTASRLHARLRLDDDGWKIRNLSNTNPTLVNGRELTAEGPEARLQDGDRVEMGEIVFVFHQPSAPDRFAWRSSWYSDRSLRPVNRDAGIVKTLAGGRELAAVCEGIGWDELGGAASVRALDSLARMLEHGGDLAEAVLRVAGPARTGGGMEGGTRGDEVSLAALLRERDVYRVVTVNDGGAYWLDAMGLRRMRSLRGSVSSPGSFRIASPDRMSASLLGPGAIADAIDAPSLEPVFRGEFSAHHPHAVVLCTDGVYGTLDGADIERVVTAAPDIRDSARLICDEAIRRGAEDNVTAAVVEFEGGLEAVRASRHPWTSR